MRRHYAELWLLLLAAFAVFAVSSAFDMPEIGGRKLKSSGIADALFAARSDGGASLAAADSLAADTASAAEPEAGPAPCDSLPKTILFIGDSMLEGLGPRMAAYADHNGHTLYEVMWYSSTSEVWGRSDRLAGYIGRIKPDYIFICLGANELFVKDIAEKRAKYVDRILADIDTIPYLWIGPPNWRDDTGINDLIASRTSRGSFFLSDGMHFERSKDGAHPTRESAAAWLDSVARWMPRHAKHPILMETPSEQSARAKRVFVHQPHEK